MEYYEKSIKLIKFMFGFVLFCLIYAYFIQPRMTESMRSGQEQMLLEQQAIMDAQKNIEDDSENENDINRTNKPVEINYNQE